MADPITAAAAAFANWVAMAVFTSAGAVSVTTAATLANIAYITAYAAAYVGLNAAVAVGLGALARSQVPDPETGKITRKQSRPLRCYAVGGPSRMSGAYMLRESLGHRLAVVLAICEGRLASIDQIYLNDDLVTLSGGFVQGQSGERYGTGDLIRLETRLGAATETHYSFLTPYFGSQWPTSARGDGIASLGYLAIHRSQESFARHFPNGEPIPSIVGAPVCYDWRDEAQDREDPSTWQACANPVVWLVFVEWYRLGRNWERCIEPVLDDLTVEADYCDDIVDADAGTETRYRVAGNYFSNTEPGAVRGAILASMDGWLSVDGKGRIVIKAGRYVEPTFTLTGEHITGYTWRSFQVSEDACNELVVSYTSSAHAFTEVEAGVFRDEADIAATGRINSEPLQLTWVSSSFQAMRLAKRKMSRLNAARRGMIRTSIYGLNGMGQRFIRVQNPELSSMADVVVEVMNVELDLARGEVAFDVILADTTIDDDEVVTPDTPDVPTAPPYEPGYQEPPETPIRKVDGPDFPIEATVGQIEVTAYTAILRNGTAVAIPDTTITGLDDATQHALFYREDEGVTAIPEADSEDYFRTGSRIFLGWQITPDSGGTYPPPPVPPPGNGGTGDIPLYVEP